MQELSSPERLCDKHLPGEWAKAENHLVILSNGLLRPPIDILQGCKGCEKPIKHTLQFSD